VKQLVTQSINAQELLIEGLGRAKGEGFVDEWEQTYGSDFLDLLARSRFDSSFRLILVRCYEPRREISVDDLRSLEEASKRCGAHMIFVIGDGARALREARIEGIGLLTFEALSEVPASFWVDLFKPEMVVSAFRFRLEEQQTEIAIPQERALLAQLMQWLKVIGPGIEKTPEQIVEENDKELAKLATSTRKTFTVELPPATLLIHPNSRTGTPISSFSCDYRLVPVCELVTKERLGVDHYMLGHTLEEELAKRDPKADPARIASGFETKLQAGKYYYNPQLQFSYYCESARKGKAKLVLVDSYQGGQFLQARFVVSTDLSGQVVEVIHDDELKRLSALLERFRLSHKDLEGRFTAFINTLEGSECIDDLELTTEQEQAKKADYFLKNRKIISEFKSLQTNTSPKINAILKPYHETPEWPVFFGEQDLQTLLSFLPDRKRINARIINAVTDSIETIIKNANKQIRTTKETFGLPDAGGLLVVFNEVVDIFSPDVVAYRVRKALSKKTESGDVRFPHVTVVLIISVGHYTQLTPTLKAMPILIMGSGLPDPNDVEGFASSLLPQWAGFDGQPLLKVKTEDFPRLIFDRFLPKTGASRKPLRRQDLWRLQYRKTPYLRSLAKDELLEYGQELFEDIGPRFLKGAPRTPEDYMMGLMERFAHFLEETNSRAIDMREMTSKMVGFKERMEELYYKYQSKES
jgi:hypothetical protein